jgi:hypothetical protein
MGGSHTVVLIDAALKKNWKKWRKKRYLQVAGLVTSMVRQLKESLTEARGEGEAVPRGGDAAGAAAAAAAAASLQSAQGLQVVLAMLDAYSSTFVLVKQVN